ncbi:D-alanyl-D-alanine carboxypeptidase/D-alanyl-D-alanine-endopeptidase [Pseudomonas sp. A3.4]|nr:D-alanyl-D-alanine carboxypeptidase/D-alanyl-D-alanine-endopeptidase [Atopomonas sediminilitoris]MCJ8167839.1 D-alanyl-D-alanine carboxypeptidase/D-alanyl-D-alanine-endopeptidase [Atopomonas sediminilitoris]
MQQHKLPADALALAVIPLDGPGQARFIGADQPLNPASTMKLVTTFAALELLGPTYRWPTRLLTTGNLDGSTLNGDLILQLGGDPKLTQERVWMLLRDLRASGVKHVNGRLLLDSSHLRPNEQQSFRDDGNDPSRPFLVDADSLLVNFKSLRVDVRTRSGQSYVTLEPPLGNVQLENQVQVKPASSCPRWPALRFESQDQGSQARIRVVGSLPNGCLSQHYVSLLDHASYTSALVRSLWQELGGSISGDNGQIATVPAGAQLLAFSQSDDVVSTIRDINKLSNNTMARQLFYGIGAQYRQASDSHDGAAAARVIQQWLRNKQISPNALVMENGSGLSRIERISARQMANMLQAAWQSPYAAEFIASLPLAGMDGTMRRRLRGTAVEGQAHMKTGSLNNVRALAGFTRDAKHHTWAVVAIINHPRPWGASQILDQVLEEVHRQGQ